MLRNVLEIDWESMKVSLSTNRGAIVLFDFENYEKGTDTLKRSRKPERRRRIEERREVWETREHHSEREWRECEAWKRNAGRL